MCTCISLRRENTVECTILKSQWKKNLSHCIITEKYVSALQVVMLLAQITVDNSVLPDNNQDRSCRTSKSTICHA